MSIELIADVWALLKEDIDYITRRDSADSLINLLIDNDFSPTEIKQAFRRDSEMLAALKDYNESHQDDEEEYEEEEEEYNEDEDEEDRW
jgi:hypothetical protein